MNVIEIKDLCKIYDSNIFAIKNITFSIKSGDFFALLGKNGAGKSTTIGILTSLIKKTNGKVFVFNYDLDYDSMKIKSFIGFVPQEYNFNQFESVLDIVLNQAGFYGIKRSLSYIRAKYFLEMFDLWDKRNVISMKLSGGMKRRLMIVRALIHDPKILILDEPTAGVDVLSRRLIWDFLRKINSNGVTIILTTHYLEEVENLCSDVAIINNGSILVNKKVKELLKVFNKRTFLLELEIRNDINLNNLCLDEYKLNIIDNGLIEVVLFKDQSLNKLFGKLIEKNISIYGVKDKSNRFEELFLDLVS